MNIVDELTWRGLINASTDLVQLKAYLAEKPRTVYVGFDPTGESLHAGHLVPLLTLRRFQQFGHTPIALAGEATAQIGDPREVGERILQSPATVNENTKKIVHQINKLFSDVSNSAELILENNIAWTKELSAIELLRDIGKHFSVNVLLARDLVKKRLASDGLSFTEFSYPLLQANDFLQLYQKHQCLIQIGGADQWGNLVSGVDLIRRKAQQVAHALTVPLVTNADGTKFGKTTGGGNLWLDPAKTSPYSWYQFFINVDDRDVIRYLKWFTFLSKAEIDSLEDSLTTEPHLRKAQQALAESLTSLVHGTEATKAVQMATAALFGKAPLAELDEFTLDSALAETNLVDFKSNGTDFDLAAMLVELELLASKGQARKLIKEGGIYINNQKITSETWQPTPEDWLVGKFLIIRKGKKNFAGVRLK